MLVFPIDAGIELASDGSTEQLAPWDLAVLSGRQEREVKIGLAIDRAIKYGVQDK